MDKWHFFDSWVHILCKHHQNFPGHYARNRIERELSIAPRYWLRVDLSADSAYSHTALVCALELVVGALRVDECVWEKLHALCDFHGRTFDWLLFLFPADLEVRVEACIDDTSNLRGFFAPLRADRHTDQTASLSAYLDAKRQLVAMDTTERLDGFQIPLTFTR